MIIRYVIDASRELDLQIERIRHQHLYGDVLLDFEVAAPPPGPTLLRSLISLHRCLVSQPTEDLETIQGWLNAGASEVLVPPDSAAPLKNQLGAHRIGEYCPRIVADLDSIGTDRDDSPVVIDDDFCKANLARIVSQKLRSDRDDGLIPTIVAERHGTSLGLVYSNHESIENAIESGSGVYWSRSRNRLWIKGEESGARQRLLRIDIDCDQDALQFLVEQTEPGFCHLQRWTCFSNVENDLPYLERHWRRRLSEQDAQSYTARLVSDSTLRKAKIREEADEVCRASNREEVIAETADLVYFALINAMANGVTSDDVLEELKRRVFHVTRRRGDAKPQYIERP